MAYQPAPPAKLKPGGVWYAIGVILIVLGVVGAIVIWVVGVKNLSDTVDNFARYRAPGARVLTFKSAGTFTIYYEGSSDRNDVPRLDITIVDSSGSAAAAMAFVFCGAVLSIYGLGKRSVRGGE